MYYVNGTAIDENSDIGEWELLHGRYLLLRKGKKTHHLVGDFFMKRVVPPSPSR